MKKVVPVIGLLGLAVGGWVFAMSLPDIIRYLKMKQM